jgi:predicted metalloprotease with PDZ domain
MWKFLGIAAGLALASGSLTAATLQRSEQKAPVQIEQLPGDLDTWVADALELVDDNAPEIRRLAVMTGRGVELGVSIRDLGAEQLKTMTGALVEDVRTGSAAEKAGIHKGDVITEFDGERLRGSRHLSRLVSETPEGRTVKATVVREGKRVDLSVTLESGTRVGGGRDFEFFTPGPNSVPGPSRDERRFFSDELPGFGAPGWGFAPGRGRLGVGIQELTPQLAEYFGTKGGVLVTSVTPDSPAAKAGLKAGDVITSINGKAISDPGQLIDVIHRADDGAELAIGFMRDRKARTTKATPESADKPKIGQPVQPI